MSLKNPNPYASMPNQEVAASATNALTKGAEAYLNNPTINLPGIMPSNIKSM